MTDHHESTLCLVYTTLPSIESAEDLANRLVTEKRAACVNIFPKMLSIYVWEEQLLKNTETAMLIKTTVSNKKRLVEWLEKNHPYQTPAILCQEVGTNDKFLAFVEASV